METSVVEQTSFSASPTPVVVAKNVVVVGEQRAIEEESNLADPGPKSEADNEKRENQPKDQFLTSNTGNDDHGDQVGNNNDEQSSVSGTYYQSSNFWRQEKTDDQTNSVPANLSTTNCLSIPPGLLLPTSINDLSSPSSSSVATFQQNLHNYLIQNGLYQEHHQGDPKIGVLVKPDSILNGQHMEYPHNENDSNDQHQRQGPQTVVVMTSSDGMHHHHTMQTQQQMHESVVLHLQQQVQQQQQQQHSQHVEVIKTAGHVAPLNHSATDPNSLQQKCEMDLQNASMLQEMKNMRMPIYELYQGGGRPSAVAGPSSAIYASNIYDSLTPSSSSMAAAAAALTNGGGGIGDPSSAYGNLATLQPAQLQPTYVNLLTNTAAVAVSATDYYAATAAATNGSADYYSRMRPLQTMPLYAPVETTDELVERLSRSSQMASSGLFNNKPIAVDMPSPVDSGIGAELMITPKQEIHDNPGFMYTDMNSIAHAMQQQQQQMQQQQQQQQQQQHQKPKESHSPRTSSSDRIVTNRESPVYIPKIETSVGFQYTLEAPISTSARRDDDRLTYLNKGQFYTVTLEYIPDPVKPLKSVTVKSIMLLVFREEKSYEDEIKCWQFWHSRQHSAKQRILDVDAKNSTGVIGAIEEVAHNAIAFYWNPTEQIVKVNVGVQCLSTDFSNQKGVKGLPLHLQVDTFDEAYSKSVPFHRGYCQVKIFCDKGANRKMLHEQRRDEKRRLNGRKKTDDEYHEPCERSPFYHMSNLSKPAVLFVPPEDYDRTFSTEFYHISDPTATTTEDNGKDLSNGEMSPTIKRKKLSYPENRVMVYVRKQDEEIFTPLHLVPPNLQGLANAISEKFNLKSSQITGLFRQNLKGYTIKMDDDMVQYYCNEDSFVIHFSLNNDDTECNNNSTFSVTLAELEVSRRSPSESPS